MFDAREFFNDNSIRFATEGHKHCRAGWVQIPCPFCTGNPGLHLGYNLVTGYFNCYRCGFHSVIEVVHALTSLSWTKAKATVREYGSTSPLYHEVKKRKHRPSEIKLPINGDLGASYLRYLRSRNFDPDRIIQEWGIAAGGPFGFQRHRIIAPITYNNTVVSYTGRDITNKSGLKYKSCKEENEIIKHKHILYGIDHVRNACILVEGITDVWRFGYGAVATFGTEVMPSQLYLLAEHMNRVFVMFDNAPTDGIAQKNAERIAWDLSSMGVETEICLIKGDPGELPQEKADKYKRELLG